MPPKRRAAIRSREGTKRPSLPAVDDQYDGLNMSDLLARDDFNFSLHFAALQAIDNRLSTPSQKFKDAQLFEYIQRVVDADEHREVLERVHEKTRSQECRVKVTVMRAENLAAKDTDGTSDPYCILSVVKGTNFVSMLRDDYKGDYPVKMTETKESNLNPEWNEEKEFRVKRGEITTCSVQVQVWDQDVGNDKKVKGFKGMGRFMKERMQIGEVDDHIGFASIPLSSVPAEGLEKWTKLKPSKHLETISGRIKVHIDVSAIQGERNQIADLQYAGLLQLCIDHALSRRTGSDEDECWNGELCIEAAPILTEFMTQHRIDQLTSALIRWEIYINAHLTENDCVLSTKFILDLLKKLDEASKVQNRIREASQLCASRYKAEMLLNSIPLFLEQSYRKIANHREDFAKTKKNYIVELGCLLKCLKQISSLTRLCPNLTDNKLLQVKVNVKRAIERGTEELYDEVYNSMNEQQLEDDLEDDPIADAELKEVNSFCKVCSHLHSKLSEERQLYQPVFKAMIDIDYFTTVYEAVSRKLGRYGNQKMARAREIMSSYGGESENPQHEQYTSSVFKLYINLKQMDALKKHTSLDANGRKNQGNIVETDSVQSKHAPEDEDLGYFYKWFRPALLRWLHLSHIKTKAHLKSAVAMDEMKRLDDIVKHSSSAIDTTACLQAVLDFWRNLQWPDPVDTYTISFRLIDDVVNSAEHYAKLVHHKLNSVGFYDLEGQFDVTQELCLALNNLEHVKSFVDSLTQKMNLQSIAERVGETTDIDLSKEDVIEKVETLMSSAMIGLKKTIQIVTDKVGDKMKPDMLRYCRVFANNIKGDSAKKCHENGFDRTRARQDASLAIQPLMTYLQDNIMNLHGWLCKPNFYRVLEILWIQSVRALKTVAIEEFVHEKPVFFNQCRYVLSQQFMDFYFADGEGISLERMMEIDEYQMLNAELKLRGVKTVDLIRLFYYRMYQDQQDMEAAPIFGLLDVHVVYNRAKSQLEVGVLRAENLLPLDINGFSDPFVVVRLEPDIMFEDKKEYKTGVQKKTLDPLFDDEPFIIKAPLSTCSLEGVMLHFGVYDHDFMGPNDLEGEAVLPLAEIQGVATEDTRDQSRSVYRLPLNNYAKTETVERSRKKGALVVLETSKIWSKCKHIFIGEPVTPNIKGRFSTQLQRLNTRVNLLKLEDAISVDRYTFDDEDDEYNNDLGSYDQPLELDALGMLQNRACHDQLANTFTKYRKKLEKLADEDRISKAIAAANGGR